MKLFSVLIMWNDNDPEQGNYGELVRAEDAAAAENKARERMLACHLQNNPPAADQTEEEAYSKSLCSGEFGGSLISCDEGAIWRATDLEKALRDLLEAMPTPASRKLTTPWDLARKIIAALDAVEA